MQIKRFYATSACAAMRDIRKTLGPDAFILSVRQLSDAASEIINGGRARFEVTAARERPEAVLRAPGSANRGPGRRPFQTRSSASSLAAAIPQGSSALDAPSATGAPTPTTWNPPLSFGPAARGILPAQTAADLREIIEELKSLRAHLTAAQGGSAQQSVRPSQPAKPSALPQPYILPSDASSRDGALNAWRNSVPPQALSTKFLGDEPGRRIAPDTLLPACDLQERLRAHGVEELLIERLIDRLHLATSQEAPDGSSTVPDGQGTFGHFVRAARDFTPRAKETERPGAGPRKMALVGPTGVGKTTSIAKIASHYALRESQRVALATLDTYRIAAADQLKTYARLLGVPIEVLSDPSQLGACFDRFADMDLVLVDTPGHSPRDHTAVARLAAALGGHPDVEIHLVLNCSTRGNELRLVMERFRPMGYNRLIFSKLDEADCWGELLNTWIMGGFEVSYFTTGQRVPEDLEPASVEFLCKGLLSAF